MTIRTLQFAGIKPSDNYIYFYHINKGITIPVDPDSITDSMSASWAQSTPLSRSAPIYSYQGSGPRTIQFNFTVHRDLINQTNPDWVRNNNIGDVVDLLISNLEACVLPDYQESGKIVNPPIVAVKLRDEIFIKGIMNSVSKSFKPPIINYGSENSPSYKYAIVDISIQVSEVTPQSASILNGIKGGARLKDARPM